jgi:hypothetical protein
MFWIGFLVGAVSIVTLSLVGVVGLFWLLEYDGEET